MSYRRIPGAPARSEPVEVQQLPAATNVAITGTPSLGNTLHGSYDYTNPTPWEPVGTLGFSEG